MVLIEGIRTDPQYFRAVHSNIARRCVMIAVRNAFRAALDGQPEDDVHRHIQPVVRRAVESAFLVAVIDEVHPETELAAMFEAYAIVEDRVEASLLAEVEGYIQVRFQTPAQVEVQPVVQGIFQVLVHAEVVAAVVRVLGLAVEARGQEEAPAVPLEEHHGHDMSRVFIGAVVAFQGAILWALLG